jgi:2-polyprenyl-6-methoxyphenol hydroxylase-like FAD-dependent oxidoreductase
LDVCQKKKKDPTPDKPLARTSRARSCPDFIDVRDRYTLLLHQGIIEREFLAEISARAPNSGVLRPLEFVSCSHKPDGEEPGDYPIEAIVKTEDGREKRIRTKYLLGCDGAKSDVRKSLGGSIRLEGEGTHIVWGVMDCWVQSDFRT